jgi:hypothetical protein
LPFYSTPDQDSISYVIHFGGRGSILTAVEAIVMRNRFANRVLLLSAILAASLFLASSASANDYLIKLERPAKVGDVRRVREIGSERTQTVTTVNGQRTKQEQKEASVKLEGEVKALEVSGRGSVTKLQCVVDKCEVTKDGQTTALVPAGKTITASREFGKEAATYTVDGKEVAAEVAERLNLVLTVGDPTKPDEDETFGTADRKKVGDIWEGNKKVIFNTLKDMKAPVQKEGIETSVRLRDVRTVSGVPCLVIDCSFAVPLTAGARLPGMPEWMKVQSGKLEMHMQETLPVDIAGKPLAATRHLSMTLTVGGTSPDGSPVTSTLTRVSHAEGTREYPK